LSAPRRKESGALKDFPRENSTFGRETIILSRWKNRNSWRNIGDLIMRLKFSGGAIILAIISVSSVAAQNVRVNIGKRATTIPKVCESVVPASIENQVDIPALVKEAFCKGAGDMLADYTYVMQSARREKDKKGRLKEEITIYEVYIPTLKSGLNTRGVLLVTSQNGVPVPPDELENERIRTGERLEKEEGKIARQSAPQPREDSAAASGMLPLGMYGRLGINRGMFGIRRGGAALSIHTVLQGCELTLLRREGKEGREKLVFSFSPRPNAQFTDDEKYLALLSGEIWIDVQDRIVSKLVGWPASVKERAGSGPDSPAGGPPPAIYAEMIRLPEGVWLPSVTRINGLDYTKLFDGVNYETTFINSQYQRFKSEIKEVQVAPPKVPQ
jgi:hypothetical protein